MALRDEFVQTGGWLFRWRSYLPLLLAAPVLVALAHYDWPWDNNRFRASWEWTCLAISFAGLLFRCAINGFVAPGTSGGNTKRQVAVKLNTDGMYSIVRHPLYFANFLMWLGVSLVPFVWWLPVFFSLAFWIYYERIMFAEEDFLRGKFRQEFEQWSAQTPAFLPRISQWRPTDRSFSTKWLLRREYNSLLALIMAHIAIELGVNLRTDGHWDLGTPWLILLCVGVGFYVVVRTLHKTTNLLHVDRPELAD